MRTFFSNNFLATIGIVVLLSLTVLIFLKSSPADVKPKHQNQISQYPK